MAKTAEVQIGMLAEQAAQGNEGAFNELYLLTRDRAYFVAYSVARNEQDALDILQESYLKAWKKLGELNTPDIFCAWLRQIVGNTAKDYVKKRRPQMFEPLDNETDLLTLQPEEDEAYIPDAAMDTAETKRLIMKIVDRLPEDQRLCVLLYYYEEMPVAEIAQSLEIPVSTVSNRLAYARKKISRAVEELEKKGGAKLYGALPLPLLIWVLRGVAVQSGTSLPPVILGGTTAAAAAGTAGAAGAAASAAGTASAASAAGGIAAGIVLPKVVAGVAAAVIVAGGSFTALKVLPKRPNIESIPTQAVAQVYESTAVSAFPLLNFTLPSVAASATAAGSTVPMQQVNSAAAVQTSAATQGSTAQTVSSAVQVAATTQYVQEAKESSSRTTHTSPDQKTQKTKAANTAATTTTTTTTTTTSTTINAYPWYSTTNAGQSTTSFNINLLYDYEIVGAGIRITRYKSTETHMSIPQFIDGLPVTEIGPSAFAGTAIWLLTVPYYVTTIGASAFANCADLQLLVIEPATVAFGSPSPFANCPQLRIISNNIPSQVYDYCIAENIPMGLG